jgi:hypothetical protein
MLLLSIVIDALNNLYMVYKILKFAIALHLESIDIILLHKQTKLLFKHTLLRSDDFFIEIFKSGKIML